MIWKQIDACNAQNPVPISFLIHVANAFDCDIFVKCENRQVNVKCYEDLKDHLRTHERKFMFLFSGADEQAAEKKFEGIFRG